MKYKIDTIPRFEKDVKRLQKRFPKIKNDLKEFINELSLNPELGISFSRSHRFSVGMPPTSQTSKNR